jgi:hypothetical protein
MQSLSQAWPALSPFVGQSGQGERKAEDEESAELPQAVAFFSSQGRRITDLENQPRLQTTARPKRCRSAPTKAFLELDDCLSAWWARPY